MLISHKYHYHYIGWCPLFSKCRLVKYLYSIKPVAKDPVMQFPSFTNPLHTVPKLPKLDATPCFNYPLKDLNHDFSLKKDSLVSLKDCFVVGNRDNKVGVQKAAPLTCLKGHNLIKSKSPGKTCEVCMRVTLSCDFLWYWPDHHTLHHHHHHSNHSNHPNHHHHSNHHHHHYYYYYYYYHHHHHHHY